MFQANILTVWDSKKRFRMVPSAIPPAPRLCVTRRCHRACMAKFWITHIYIYRGVLSHRGTSKPSILIGFSIINQLFLDTPWIMTKWKPPMTCTTIWTTCLSIDIHEATIRCSNGSNGRSGRRNLTRRLSPEEHLVAIRIMYCGKYAHLWQNISVLKYQSSKIRPEMRYMQ